MKAIYIIKNKQNDKIYIGSATNFKNRLSRHKSDLNQDRHHNIHLQRAWNKHGEDSFEFFMLEKVEKSEDLISREQHYIDLHNSVDNKVGYNIAPIAGSSLGVKHTQETKDKFSERNIKRYKDPENRKKTGDASRKAWCKPGVKEAASKRMKKRWSDEEELRAQRERMKKLCNSDKHRAKVSKGLRDKRFSKPEERRKASLRSPNRKIIKHVETGIVYESISHAIRVLPISIQTIKNNLKGKFKSAKGYNFIEVVHEQK